MINVLFAQFLGVSLGLALVLFLYTVMLWEGGLAVLSIVKAVRKHKKAESGQ